MPPLLTSKNDIKSHPLTININLFKQLNINQMTATGLEPSWIKSSLKQLKINSLISLLASKICKKKKKNVHTTGHF